MAALVALLATAGWRLSATSDGESTSAGAKGGKRLGWQEEMVWLGKEELRHDEQGRRRRFAFLRGRTEAIPTAMKRAIAGAVGGVSALGLHFDHSRLLPTTIGVGVWVIEGDEVTCISLARDGSTACDTSLRAWRGGLPLQVASVGGSPEDRSAAFLAIGLVPNWASGVRVSIRGRSRIARAPYGAYGVRATAPIRDVHPVR